MINLVKKAFFRLGIISAYHRRKNKNVLTVVMLHRVLPTQEPRWSSADKEWTVSEKLFNECIDFFKRHYNFVSLAEVEHSLHGRGRLPARALLLTFDDGWSDNFDYAYPILKREKIPALIFVAAAAVNRKPPFWREAIVMAMNAGYLSAERCKNLVDKAGQQLTSTCCSAQGLIATLSACDEQSREQWLEESGVYEFLRATHPAYMLNAEQLKDLSHHNVAIGVHGYTHNPIATDGDWRKELQSSRDSIQGHLDGELPNSFSFPHGRYDGTLIKRALEIGYRILFTSDANLIPLDCGQITSPVLGRVHFAPKDVTDKSGQFAPEKMAFWLFKRSAKNVAYPARERRAHER